MIIHFLGNPIIVRFFQFLTVTKITAQQLNSRIQKPLWHSDVAVINYIGKERRRNIESAESKEGKEVAV